ncbi:hypothetical protein ISS85_01650 [Candidatus Microgenomates bacterium]|nr:hypothetical protein [Candidatus Microgenomates bacterium]
MKKQRKPGLVSEFEKEVGETVKTGKEQVSLGQAFSELLSQIFGGATPPTPERMKELKTEEDKMGREARAKVLEQFMGPAPAPTERVYEVKQKEETTKRMKMQKEAKKKSGMEILQAPQGKTQRGSAFASLRRKKTGVERKGGKF